MSQVPTLKCGKHLETLQLKIAQNAFAAQKNFLNSVDLARTLSFFKASLNILKITIQSRF